MWLSTILISVRQGALQVLTECFPPSVVQCPRIINCTLLSGKCQPVNDTICITQQGGRHLKFSSSSKEKKGGRDREGKLWEIATNFLPRFICPFSLGRYNNAIDWACTLYTQRKCKWATICIIKRWLKRRLFWLLPAVMTTPDCICKHYSNKWLEKLQTSQYVVLFVFLWTWMRIDDSLDRFWLLQNFPPPFSTLPLPQFQMHLTWATTIQHPLISKLPLHQASSTWTIKGLKLHHCKL